MVPHHGHGHHCLGLCFTQPGGDGPPPRAGPSTPAWLRGSLAVGPPGGPWAGTGGSEADLLFRGVKVLPTLRKQHPSPGPRPAPFGSPDPSPLKRPPGRLQDLGRVCVTPETWDESRLPSGAPRHWEPHPQRHPLPGPVLQARPAAPKMQPGAGGERTQSRPPSLGPGGGRRAYMARGVRGVSSGPGGGGGGQAFPARSTHEAQGPRPILRPHTSLWEGGGLSLSPTPSAQR